MPGKNRRNHAAYSMVKQRESQFSSVADIVAYYEATFPEKLAAIKAMAPAELAKKFPNSTLIQSILEQNKGGEEEVLAEEDEAEAGDESEEGEGEWEDESEGEAEEGDDEADEDAEASQRPESPDEILAETLTMCRRARAQTPSSPTP